MTWEVWKAQVKHPDWYPELSSKSTNAEVAKVLYQSGSEMSWFTLSIAYLMLLTRRGAPGVPRVCEVGPKVLEVHVTFAHKHGSAQADEQPGHYVDIETALSSALVRFVSYGRSACHDHRANWMSKASMKAVPLTKETLQEARSDRDKVEEALKAR